MSEPTPEAALSELLTEGVLDADLASLVWLLAESGVPLVVASTELAAARRLRGAITAILPTDRRAADMTLAGGTILAGSLEDVLRVLGGSGADELSDAARDLGVVLVLRDGRVSAAHYVRPVERDAAGHLQRRPPAVLSAGGSDPAAVADKFYWAITDELATRAGLDRAEFEAEHLLRLARLSNIVPGTAGAGAATDARN